MKSSVSRLTEDPKPLIEFERTSSSLYSSVFLAGRVLTSKMRLRDRTWTRDKKRLRASSDIVEARRDLQGNNKIRFVQARKRFALFVREAFALAIARQVETWTWASNAYVE